MISNPMRINMPTRLAFRAGAQDGISGNSTTPTKRPVPNALNAERFQMTALISISHVTRYRYDRPVEFGPHRLLVRPRDGHDLRVLEANLAITPTAQLHWQFDVFGNSVAHAVFSVPAEALEIRSDLLLKRYAGRPAGLVSDRTLRLMPVGYSADNLTDLAPYIPMRFPQEREALEQWLNSTFFDRPNEVFKFLSALSATIHASFAYSRREERGTQSAMATVTRQTGTCRDFAFLFMECARYFGFAARFVTGYLHVQEDGVDMLQGGGSTHAWADVYVPGEGWVEFDPTNLIEASQSLIRIAVTRTPEQATPISGTYRQGDGMFLDMFVDVNVREVPEDDE
jgi:transglutaminase-like putative cysteine protease